MRNLISILRDRVDLKNKRTILSNPKGITTFYIACQYLYSISPILADLFIETRDINSVVRFISRNSKLLGDLDVEEVIEKIALISSALDKSLYSSIALTKKEEKALCKAIGRVNLDLNEVVLNESVSSCIERCREEFHLLHREIIEVHLKKLPECKKGKLMDLYAIANAEFFNVAELLKTLNESSLDSFDEY